MSIRGLTLEAVPGTGWLKRKKAPSWLLEIVDDPSFDDTCQTINGGETRLGYIVLNNLGVRGRTPSVPPGAYHLEAYKIEPSEKGNFHHWKVSLDDIDLVITKSANDQWQLFERLQDCDPLCALVTKTRVTLIFEVNRYDAPPWVFP